jgi:hypothetical protein
MGGEEGGEVGVGVYVAGGREAEEGWKSVMSPSRFFSDILFSSFVGEAEYVRGQDFFGIAG